MAQPRIHNLRLLADYHQIHVVAVGHRGDDVVAWTDADVASMLVVTPAIVAIGTARDLDVPLRVELHDARPDVVLDDWDQVAECSIPVPGQRLMVKGCSDYEPDAFVTDVPSPRMSMRILWAGLDSIDEYGIEGKDRYAVQLWPGTLHGISYPKRRTPPPN